MAVRDIDTDTSPLLSLHDVEVHGIQHGDTCITAPLPRTGIASASAEKSRWGNGQPRPYPMPPTLLGAFLLGLGSWIAVNGIFSELPVLALSVPEGYNVYSWAAVLVALGNIAAGLTYWWVRRNLGVVVMVRVSAVLIALALASLLVLVWTWDKTASFGGTQHSYMLFIILFVTGGVDCSTSVTFYPVVQVFLPAHVTALAVGESVTGAVGSVLGIAQTQGKEYGEERFSAPVFFLILYTVMLLSALGLAILYHYIRRYALEVKADDVTIARGVGGGGGGGGRSGSSIDSTISSMPMNSPSTSQGICPSFLSGPNILYLSQFIYAFCENGVLTIFPPYATSGYQRAHLLQSWCVYTMLIMSPLGNALAYLLLRFPNCTNRPEARGPRPGHLRYPALALTVALTTGIIIIACISPGNDSAEDKVSVMGALIVVIFAVAKFIIAYGKTSEYLCAHAQGSRAGQRVFRRMGLAIQTGSCIGSVLFFILTTVTKTIH